MGMKWAHSTLQIRGDKVPALSSQRCPQLSHYLTSGENSGFRHLTTFHAGEFFHLKLTTSTPNWLDGQANLRFFTAPWGNVGLCWGYRWYKTLIPIFTVKSWWFERSSGLISRTKCVGYISVQGAKSETPNQLSPLGLDSKLIEPIRNP